MKLEDKVLFVVACIVAMDCLHAAVIRTCGSMEYFDLALGSCYQCSDICIQGTEDLCVAKCQGNGNPHAPFQVSELLTVLLGIGILVMLTIGLVKKYKEHRRQIRYQNGDVNEHVETRLECIRIDHGDDGLPGSQGEEEPLVIQPSFENVGNDHGDDGLPGSLGEEELLVMQPPFENVGNDHGDDGLPGSLGEEELLVMQPQHDPNNDEYKILKN